MRCLVYIPTGVETNNPRVTPSTRVEVDTDNLEALLAKLADEGPARTRVVAFTERGSTHYVLDNHGRWEAVLQAIVA